MIQAFAGEAPLSIYRAYEFALSAHIGHFSAGKLRLRTLQPGPPNFVSQPPLARIQLVSASFHLAQNKAYKGLSKPSSPKHS
jgi:hypothetical protein